MTNRIMRLSLILFIIMTITSMAVNATQPTQKKLPPCQDTPNCVSSQTTSKKHYIAPFKISGDPTVAWQELRKAIIARDRMILTHETETTLHAEATSLVLRFVDDIDAIMDVSAGVIHIRSASRLGHSDFGVNRKRIEKLRTQLRNLHVLG
jgi:uncharacterized protein (DUF1499 family)